MGPLILFSVGILCILVSAVWYYRIADSEPGLVGTIDTFLVGDYTPPGNPEGKFAMVHLIVTIKNTGAPTIVERYSMQLKYANGVTVKGQAEAIPENFTVVTYPEGEREILSSADQLDRKTTQPISTGNLQQGRLMYRFPDVVAAFIRGQGDIIELSYQDVWGKRYVITHKMSSYPIIKPKIQSYPGMTPPIKVQ